MQENGESSFLDNHRVEVLKEMGFSWAGRPGPAKGTRKATRLIDESWDEMMEELTKFKQQYGHCDVPRNSEDEEYAALYKWVCGVRKEHKALPENAESPVLDDSRVEALNALGFSWAARSGPAKGSRRRSTEEEISRFDTMLPQLKDHKDDGIAIRANPPLQLWISDMRKEYRLLQENKDSFLTQERVVQLAQHGFSFNAKKKISWNDRAIKWLEHKNRYGKDPKRYSEDGLGKWCGIQRTKYKIFQEGGKTNLTEAQIKQLTDWGFSWEPKLKRTGNMAAKRPWE